MGDVMGVVYALSTIHILMKSRVQIEKLVDLFKWHNLDCTNGLIDREEKNDLLKWTEFEEDLLIARQHIFLFPN